MTRLLWFRMVGVVAISLMARPMVAQAGDPGVLQQRLSAQMKLTRTTADRTDIVTAGDVVVIHKAGVVMFDVGSPLPPTNVYKDGRIGFGFGTQMMLSDRNQQLRRFVPDEKCFVTRIVVLNDSVLIDLYSDPFNDVRYYATLKFPFPNKKEVPSVDSLLATIAQVLTVVPPDQSDQSAAGAAAPAAAPAAPVAPPAPLQSIAPPPPPSDAPPPTVSMGETKDQIIAAFGQPTKAAKLGAKEIYYYKDMKITFMNGKVSNVE